MLSDVSDELDFLLRAQELRESLAIFFWAELGRRHRQELVVAVAVARDSGIVDREESQGLAVNDPHRHRVAFKEKAERILPRSSAR